MFYLINIILTILLVFYGESIFHQAQGETQLVNSNKQAIETLTTISDQVFYESDENKIIYDVDKKLLAIKFEGLAIGAPQKLDINRQEELPIIFVSKESTARSKSVVLADNCILVAFDWEKGLSWLGSAFVADESKIPVPLDSWESMEPPPLENGATSISTTVVELIKLKSRLNLPWASAHLAVTTISFNWKSNTVAINLVDSKKLETTHLTKDRLEHALTAMEQIPGQAEPGKHFPDFRRSTISPSLDEKNAALAVPYRAKESTRSLPVYAAFQIPVSEAWLVDAATMKSKTLEQRARGTVYKNIPNAVVPAFILVVQKNVLTPKKLELNVPVFTSEIFVAGQSINGYFSIDLIAAIKDPLTVGHYQLYMFVGEHVAGPYSLAVE